MYDVLCNSEKFYILIFSGYKCSFISYVSVFSLCVSLSVSLFCSFSIALDGFVNVLHEQTARSKPNVT